jgi:hypothetical protein
MTLVTDGGCVTPRAPRSGDCASARVLAAPVFPRAGTSTFKRALPKLTSRFLSRYSDDDKSAIPNHPPRGLRQRVRACRALRMGYEQHERPAHSGDGFHRAGAGCDVADRNEWKRRGHVDRAEGGELFDPTRRQLAGVGTGSSVGYQPAHRRAHLHVARRRWLAHPGQELRLHRRCRFPHALRAVDLVRIPVGRQDGAPGKIIIASHSSHPKNEPFTINRH